jgi:TetR/AcrR family transcriptional repressor of lmrAB and yxaGH operons
MGKADGQGSRSRMLDAAIVLMRGSGLSGAGINEIVRESGSPKGSVYHFFPGGKVELCAEALQLYSLGVGEFIDAALEKGTAPGEKVKALFDAFALRVEEGGFQKSCAAGTVTLDLDADMDALRAVLDRAFSDWITAIVGHFRFADARKTRSFAGLVLTAIEGAYIRCRAERSSRPFREAGAWLAELAERHAESAATPRTTRPPGGRRRHDN